MASAAPGYTPLAPEQRRLLLAALSSYRKTSLNQQQQQQSSSPSAGIPPSETTVNGAGGVSPSVFSNSPTSTSRKDASKDSTLSLFDPYDDNFSFGGEDSPGDRRSSLDNGLSYSPVDGDSQGEKRKSPGEDSADGEDDFDAKRHEGDDKSSKKPGRKPLTSEPTTKRKAQNRAAQRAFRERKEKHLKDLETKVADLEKASESANHENGILRAQIERLQDELSGYRRRVSAAGNSVNSSPPANRPGPQNHRQSTNSIDEFDFSFDFPRFGDGSSTANTATTQNSINNVSMSSNATDLTPSTAIHSSENDAMGSMFGTGFFDGIVNKPNVTQSPQSYPTNDTPSVLNWASPANSASTASRSPSGSNQVAGNSSCCTSPDESNWALNYNNKSNPSENGFSAQNTPGLTNAKTPDSSTGQPNIFGNDWLSSQNGGQFDPVLFGDYRDSQDTFGGNADFAGSFFEEGLAFQDLNNPFAFNLATDQTIPAPVIPPANEKPKQTLLDQVAAQRDGGDQYDQDLVIPGEVKKNQPGLMACYKIWNQLQNCPRFKSGDFDIDDLCSDLASKATCTESGLAFPKEKVEAALWKLASEGEANPNGTAGASTAS